MNKKDFLKTILAVVFAAPYIILSKEKFKIVNSISEKTYILYSIYEPDKPLLWRSLK